MKCSGRRVELVYLFVLFLATVFHETVASNKTFDCSSLQPVNAGSQCPSGLYLPLFLNIKWTPRNGWEAPKIEPYRSLQIDPASRTIQRGLTVFEGLHSRIDDKNNMRLLNLEPHSSHTLRFAKRFSFPNFEVADLMKCLQQLYAFNKPVLAKRCQKPYNAVQLRTAITATENKVTIEPPQEVLLYAYLTYNNHFQPEGRSRLYIDPKPNRVWPGHMTYDVKAASNYQSSFTMIKYALEKGFDDLLWLFDGNLITELSHANVFFVLKHDSEKVRFELVTPQRLVYAGKTRKNVMDAASNWTDVKLTERDITFVELVAAEKEKRLLEAFHTNVVTHAQPISAIFNQGTGHTIELPANGSILSSRFNQLMDQLFFSEEGLKHQWITVV